MALVISPEAQQLLQALSGACSANFNSFHANLRPVSRGREIICNHNVFTKLQFISIVKEFSAGSDIDVDFPTPDIQVPQSRPFLRLQGCHIADENDRPRPILAGFLDDIQNAPNQHGILALIYPDTDNETHLATYTIIDSPEEYSRMHLGGTWASVILGDKADDIKGWTADQHRVHAGWRCLAIVVEYVLLLKNIPSLLLNWSVGVKVEWLREACMRVEPGERAQSQQAAVQPSRQNNVQIKTVRGEDPRILVTICIERGRLSRVTGVTQDG